MTRLFCFAFSLIICAEPTAAMSQPLFGHVNVIPEESFYNLRPSLNVKKDSFGMTILSPDTKILPPASFFAGQPDQSSSPKQLHEMNRAEIDAFIRETGSRHADFLERLQIHSERALGAPYRWFPLGEGPQGKYDRDPLIDFAHVDCLTFCEQILAMALADNYDEMFQRLQRLRYRGGEIDIRERNHFTISDWLTNNSWLVEDITTTIGGELCVGMTKTIDRVEGLRKKGVPAKELAAIPPPQTMTIKYIPEANLPAIKSKLRGEEIAVIMQSRSGIFAAHLGFMLRDSAGQIFFRNASARRGVKKVVDEDFDELVKFLRRNPSWVGMVFLRVRPEFMNNPEVVAREILKPAEANRAK